VLNQADHVLGGTTDSRDPGTGNRVDAAQSSAIMPVAPAKKGFRGFLKPGIRRAVQNLSVTARSGRPQFPKRTASTGYSDVEHTHSRMGPPWPQNAWTTMRTG
jgi:hypothetical protein